MSTINLHLAIRRCGDKQNLGPVEARENQIVPAHHPRKRHILVPISWQIHVRQLDMLSGELALHRPDRGALDHALTKPCASTSNTSSGTT